MQHLKEPMVAAPAIHHSRRRIRAVIWQARSATVSQYTAMKLIITSLAALSLTCSLAIASGGHPPANQTASEFQIGIDVLTDKDHTPAIAGSQAGPIDKELEDQAGRFDPPAQTPSIEHNNSSDQKSPDPKTTKETPNQKSPDPKTTSSGRPTERRPREKQSPPQNHAEPKGTREPHAREPHECEEALRNTRR